MQAVDLQGILGEYIFDPNRKISQAHLDSVCKPNTAEACRYICLSVPGYICVKKTPIKDALDQRVNKNQMGAMGDNCEGLE